MKIVASVCVLLASSAGLAAEPAAPPASSVQASASKPATESRGDRLVCEEQEELGSRLKSHRVCLRASEWAERRRLERMSIQKKQVGGQCTHLGYGC